MAIQTDALLIAISARTTDMEAGLKRAGAKIAELEANARRTGSGLQGAFDRMGVGADNLKRSFGNVATGVLMMTGTFDDAGKAGKILEQTLGGFLAGGPIGAGVALVSGAFRLLASDTGKATAKADEADKAYKTYLDDLEKRLQDSRKELQGLRDDWDDFTNKSVAGTAARLRTQSGVSNALGEAEIAFEGAKQALELNARRKEIDALFTGGVWSAETRSNLQSLNSELQMIERISGPRGNDAGLRKRFEDAAEAVDLLKQRLSDLNQADLVRDKLETGKAAEKAVPPIKDAAAATNDLADALDRLFAEMDAKEAAFARGFELIFGESADWRKADEAANRLMQSSQELIESLRTQEAIAKATTEEERDRLEIQKEMKALIDSGRLDFLDADAYFDAAIGARKAERDRRLRESMVRAGAEAGKAAGNEAGGTFTEAFQQTIVEMDPFWKQIGQTVGSSLTDGIVSLILDGGDRIHDVLDNLIRSLLTQTVGALVNSGLGALFGLLPGGTATSTVGGGTLGIAGGIPAALGAALGGGGGGGCANGQCFGPMPEFAEGGYVRRTGPALVHEGEYVIPKHAMRGGGGIHVHVGPVNVQAGGNVQAIADAAAGRVRERILTSAAMQNAIRKANSGL